MLEGCGHMPLEDPGLGHFATALHQFAATLMNPPTPTPKQPTDGCTRVMTKPAAG